MLLLYHHVPQFIFIFVGYTQFFCGVYTVFLWGIILLNLDNTDFITAQKNKRLKYKSAQKVMDLLGSCHCVIQQHSESQRLFQRLID